MNRKVLLCDGRKTVAGGCIIATLLVLVLFPSPSAASTWTNILGDGNWNDGLNWGGGDFTGGPGAVPDQAGSIGAAVGAVPLTINQSGLTALYMIVNNQVDITGGDLVYTGDGLWGSGIGGGSGGDPDPDDPDDPDDPVVLGMATVNQTGGTLTQTGGGAGFLVGHNRPAEYNISGGSIVVQETSPGLFVDFAYPAVGSSSDPSVLNVSGDAVVDVFGPRLGIGPQGTLNVTGNGRVIWRNHSVADLDGDITFENFPEPDNGPRPVIDPTGVLNARAIQVGPDVHLVAVPEPTTVWLGMTGLVALFSTVARARRPRQ